MRLRGEQLPMHLRQARDNGPAPVYLLSGDVPLLVQEAADSVRWLARECGCHERIVLEVDRGFDWQYLMQEAGGLSLFAERRVIELRLPDAKPGDKGSKVLQAYVEQVRSAAQGGSEGDILLIIAGKLEKQSLNSKWFKALDSEGVIVQFWPLGWQQLEGWIEQRLNSRGLRGDREAVKLLAERSEGNLLACAQEIDKLQLLHGGLSGTVTMIDTSSVMQAVVDSARYDVFTLVDGALAGDFARVARIVEGLRAEGTEPTVVLWALARELRVLLSITTAMSGGSPLASQLARLRVWDSRKNLVGKAAQRLKPAVLQAMLVRASRLDRVIKGKATGNVWDELLQLSLMLAGMRPMKMVS